MRLKVFLLLLFCCNTLCVRAQIGETDKYIVSLASQSKDTVAWVVGGSLNIGLNQGFLHNWRAGGELGSITVNGLGTFTATRYYRRNLWTNKLLLAYSLYYAYSNRFVPRKIDDRIDYSTSYGYRLKKKSDFYLTALANFRSQLSNGYDYSNPRWDTFTTSKLMSPAYLIGAVGMEFRPNKKWGFFLSPFATRLTYVDRQYTLRRPEGAFGVAYAKEIRFEEGAYFRTTWATDLTKNISYQSRLELYSNYLARDKKDTLGRVVMRDNAGNVDWFWDNIMTYKVTRLVSMTLALNIQYDNDLPYSNTYKDKSGAIVAKNEPGEELGWWQVKQVLTLGLLYKF